MTNGKFWLSSIDAIDYLRSLTDSSVDLAITDPPYESLEKHRSIGTTTRLKHSKASSNNWFSIFPNSRFADLFRELYRVLRRDSHLYFFCDAETAFVAKPIAEAAGFKFWKPLIWDKKRIGMGYHYRARYEFILFFEKGKRRLNDLGVSDIIEAPRIYNGYPTEKPVVVSEVLVRQSSSSGDLVVDPFMGSGSVGVAAVKLGRDFSGSDTCAEAVSASRARLLDSGATEADADSSNLRHGSSIRLKTRSVKKESTPPNAAELTLLAPASKQLIIEGTQDANGRPGQASAIPLRSSSRSRAKSHQ
jgi:site-specific DNA-methyltransferase (adenine-specific)